MIIGIGNDLTDIRRIERTLEKFGERFIHRCFGEEEIIKAERGRKSGNHVKTYAKRFAAKEACAKALGTGFNHGVYLRDIVVTNDANGKPALRLTGGAARWLGNMTPEGKTAHIHLTLTDEIPLAMAVVVIEAL